MMRLVLLLAVVAVAAASPVFLGQPQHRSDTFSQRQTVPILVDERIGPDQFGHFSFRYETADGISHQAIGSPVGEASFQVLGSYTYTSPEGEFFEIQYVADENGFQPSGAHLPTPPPMPAHALAQFRAGEEAFARQRAGGFQQQIQSPSRRQERTRGHNFSG